MLMHNDVTGAAPAATICESRPAPSRTVFFEIVRGQTQFPIRPLTGERFLIGSGDWCDLRVGGDMPVLHSVVALHNGELWIDAIASSPLLLVNGSPTESTRLSGGATVEIGGISFRVHMNQVAAAVTGAPDQEPAPADAPAETLTAAELVSRIEEETHLVDEFEARRELGARALLDAVASRAARLQSVGREPVRPLSPAVVEETHIPAADENVLWEMSRMLQQVNAWCGELENRSQQIAEREADYSESASLLLDVQQKILSQLDELQDQIAALRTRHSRQTDRKIA